MTDAIEAGLLAEIRERPQDDFPRLVYADWCDENGREERAEFIRVQVELAQREADGRDRSECSWGGTCCCRSHELRRLERTAWESTSAGPCKPDHPFLIPGVGLQEWHSLIPSDSLADSRSETVRLAIWRRGFAHIVRCPLAAWLEHGPSIVAAHPVERVEISDREPLDMDHSGLGEWRWAWTWNYGRLCKLPTDLFAALLECHYHSPDAMMDGADPETLMFRTREDAIGALSDACLSLARRRRAVAA